MLVRTMTLVRMRLEMTEEELAEKTGLSVEQIRDCEAGNYLPSIPELRRIAAALGWEGEPIDLLNRETL